MRQSSVRVLLCAIFCCGITLPVFSQNPPEIAPPPSPPVTKVRVEVVGQSDTYKADESATATKVVTPVRDVPQTLVVIPRTVLVDQNAQSLGDAVRNAPGVTVAQGEGNRDQLVIHGLGTTSDFFVNGVRDDQERFRDLYNVERVEVLEGPAAVLYGRGGAGGIVNLVTRRPARTAGSNASVEAGSFGHKRATTQLTLPAGTRAVFGLSATGERSGGFREGFFLRRYAANPTLDLFVGQRSRVLISAEHARDHRLADRGIPSQSGRPVRVPRKQMFGSRAQNDAHSDVDSAAATIEHVAANGFVVRNTTLAGRYGKFYRNVFAGTSVSPSGTLSLSAYEHTNNRANVFNQTDVIARTRAGGMDHVVLLGLEAGHQAQDELRRTPTSIAATVGNSEREADFAAARVTIRRDAVGTVLAAYVQDQIALTTQWKLVGGARLDRFAVSVHDAVGSVSKLSRTDTALSPRAGLIFQPSATMSFYSSYGSTFLPSGQTIGLAANTQDLEPENAKNYEVGAKVDLASGRMQLTGAAFRLDRNNVKNIDPNDVTKLVLTGQQRADGFSFTAAGDAGRVKVQAAYGFLDARITRDTASGPAGRRPGLAPKHRGSVWATLPLSGRWGAGGGALWQSDTFTSFTNQVTLPGFVRADGLVYYRTARWRVAVNVDNIFNARYFPTAHTDNNISPGAPRAIQLSLRAGF